jgi:hypothetical protein
MKRKTTRNIEDLLSSGKFDSKEVTVVIAEKYGRSEILDAYFSGMPGTTERLNSLVHANIGRYNQIYPIMGSLDQLKETYQNHGKNLPGPLRRYTDDKQQIYGLLIKSLEGKNYKSR